MISEFIAPEILGFILIGVMLFSIFVGFPISFTLIFLGFVFGYLGFGKLVFYLMTLQFSMVMTEQTLAAVPLFVFMGIMMEQAGLMERLFSAFQLMLAKVRGSLYYAVLFVSVVFAAATGIVGASVTILGIMAAKSMNRSGYNVRLAAGTITAGGTLGILIPPSIVMLVYSAATEVSASRMFMAGLIPGLMMGSILMLAIYIIARYKKLPSKPFPGIKQLFRSGFIAMGGLALIFIVLGAIYGGVASPTEAAAVAAIYAYLIAVFGYRDIGPLKGVEWRKAKESLMQALSRNILLMGLAFPKSTTDKEVRRVILDGAKVSIMLLFIIANAMLFAHVLTTERIPHIIAETIIGWGLEPWSFLIIVNILLLLAGNFMEPSAIILIMAPILFPIATQLGIDPIHLGIIMVVNMEIGMLTPPVGLNLFVTAGITGKSMGWVIKACLPWLSLLLIFLMLITYVPQISLAFPEYIDKLNGY